MPEPGFRILTKEELDKLSVREHIEYMKALIAHLHRQIEDAKKSIAAREEWLQKSRDSFS